MRAVRLDAVGGPLRVEEVPTPEPTGTEVRIRIAGAGVCRTDLHVIDGTQPRVELPRTLGHEIAGWIDAVGPAADLATHGLAVGHPVVVFGGWGCGRCDECRAGEEQRCERSVAPGFQADGGYAEAMLVPEARHLVPLGDVDPGAAAPLGDAGMTAHRAVARARPWLTEGARVVVIGAGGVGQFVVALLRLVPPAGSTLRIGVLEPSPERRRRARELGADADAAPGSSAALERALGGRPRLVVDVVGSDATLADAAALVAPDGLVLLVGEAGGSVPFGFALPALEAWFTTVAWGSAADLRAVVALAQDGRLRWDAERVALARAGEAHDRLRSGEVLGRLVLVP